MERTTWLTTEAINSASSDTRSLISLFCQLKCMFNYFSTLCNSSLSAVHHFILSQLQTMCLRCRSSWYSKSLTSSEGPTHPCSAVATCHSTGLWVPTTQPFVVGGLCFYERPYWYQGSQAVLARLSVPHIFNDLVLGRRGI